MKTRAGFVYNKNNRYGIFGKKKYYVGVKYMYAFNRKGTYKYDYEVSADLYNNIIVGAAVTGSFEQAPEGLEPRFFPFCFRQPSVLQPVKVRSY